MIDSTSVLFGLEDEFVVTSLERLSSSDLRVVIELRERGAPCPGCGVLTARVKERPLVRVKDLHACGQVVELWWRKRRLTCPEERITPSSVNRVIWVSSVIAHSRP